MGLLFAQLKTPLFFFSKRGSLLASTTPFAKLYLYKGSFAHFACICPRALAPYSVWLIARPRLVALALQAYLSARGFYDSAHNSLFKQRMGCSLRMHLPSRTRAILSMAYCSLTTRCACFASLLVGERLHCWNLGPENHITHYNSAYPFI